MQAEYLDPRSIPVNQLLHRIRQIHMDETYKQRAVTQAEKAEVVRSLKPLLKMGFPEYVRLRGFHPEWDRGTTALVTVQDEWNLMGVFYESNGGTVVGIT
ncbi:MAG: hypothetical protein EA401_08045 [Planctomycetota bacterium]|nr:MAG: hypothetical protein EA401_08045 [Planctomycetota bacterium]